MQHLLTVEDTLNDDDMCCMNLVSHIWSSSQVDPDLAHPIKKIKHILFEDVNMIWNSQ